MVGPLTLLKMLHCTKMNRKKKPAIIYNKDPSRESSCGSSSSAPLNIKTENNLEYDQNLCRVCLKEGDIPIFGLKDLSEDLSTLAGIELSFTDGYPKNLCTSCNALLQGAILFRKTAQESDHVLRNPSPEVNLDSPMVESDNESMNQDLTSINDIVFNYEEEKAIYDKKVKVKMSQVKTEQQINVDDKEAVRPKTFHCKMCKLDFETIDEYSVHRLSVGHDVLRETCPVCKKSYNSIYLKKHIALHKKDSPFMCDICGKKFKVQNQFTRHRLTHFIDELPFKCPLCPYRGRFNENVKLHMRTHTGEKPHKCPQCPSRSFINKSNLSKHMLTHKTDYDFRCDQCQRGFYKKRDLEQHFKVDHSGIKDHICNICGKAFGYRKQMMKHQLKVHKRDKMRSGRTPLYVILESKKNPQPSEEVE